ncbi:hypothetical protein D3C80_1958640 [compost metagenome]
MGIQLSCLAASLVESERLPPVVGAADFPLSMLVNWPVTPLRPSLTLNMVIEATLSESR